MYKNIINLALIYGMTGVTSAYAASTPVTYNPFYVGVSGGFGSTTWKGLVPTEDKQNSALAVSTPIKVKEGGTAWGLFTGYEFTPYFALEANFRHYPSAEVFFDEFSLYAFEHNEQRSFNTDTDTISLMAKIMLTVPKTPVRVYSSFGVAGVHRMDAVFKQYQMGPTFGAGFAINATQHLMVDIGFNYTTGYGESALSPANTFIPFLYSANVGFSYRV